MLQSSDRIHDVSQTRFDRLSSPRTRGGGASLWLRVLGCLALAGIGALPARLAAADWTMDAAGDWFDAGNWDSTPPNGSGETARFVANLTADRTVSLNSPATIGEIVFEDSTAPYFSTIVDGAGSLTFAGGASIRANQGGANEIAVDINTGAQQLAVRVPNAGDVVRISGSITGTGGLQKYNDAGTLELTGDNSSWSGTKMFRVGRYGFGHDNSLGSGTLQINTGTVYSIGGDRTIANFVQSNTGPVAINFDGTNGHSLTFSNSFTVSGLNARGSGVLAFTGDLTGSGQLDTDEFGGTIHFYGDNWDSGTGTGYTISELRDMVHVGIGSDTALGNPGQSWPIIRDVTLEALDAPRTIANDMQLHRVSGSYALRLTGEHDITLSGTISNRGTNVGGMVKSGSHTLTLTEVNTYSGGTVINGGMVVADDADALGTGAITVNDGGVFAVGTGVTFLQPVTFNLGSGLAGDGTLQRGSDWSVPADGDGFTLSPGFSTGTLTVDVGTGNSLNLAANTTTEIEIAALNDHDILDILGAGALAGDLDIVLLGGYSPAFGETFDVITASEGLTGMVNLVGANAMWFSAAVVGDNTLQLTSLIPEPGSALLLALLAASVSSRVGFAGRESRRAGVEKN